MKTSKIVTTGLHAIVRHPQYLVGILISIALACMSQHWFVDAFILLPLLLTHLDGKREYTRHLEKFGTGYSEYMNIIPRIEPTTTIKEPK